MKRRVLVTQVQEQTEDVSTRDTQEKMYRRRLEQREWNQGLTIQEILDKVNDPSKFSSKSRE